MSNIRTSELFRKSKHTVKDRPLLLTIVLFIIQLLVLVYVFFWFEQQVRLFNALFTIISLVMIIYISSKDIGTSYKMVWIILLGIFPVFGGLLYLFFYVVPGTERIIERLKNRIAQMKPYMVQNDDVVEKLVKMDHRFHTFANYLYNMGPYPVYSKSRYKYFPIGDGADDLLVDYIESAEDFIFFEYFIIKQGIFLEKVFSAFERAVKRGVEVRVLYDGSTMLNLPKDFEDRLKSIGIELSIFSPIAPILSTYQNNRDHRKILVIDGKYAFTGGINIADEYLNINSPYGHWKDNYILIEGDAVKTFSALFLQMWNTSKQSEEDYGAYLNVYHPVEENGNYFIPYGDAPQDGESLAENVYLDILYNAKDYVYIMTPYLILNQELKTALTFAAKKGVDVRIIIPGIPDKKVPYYVALSYLEELMEDGVKIYKYTTGFIHSKVFVSDDVISTVGTVNLDFRSLYLHFENGVVIYGDIEDIKEDFLDALKSSKRVRRGHYSILPRAQQLLGKVLRVFAPLM